MPVSKLGTYIPNLIAKSTGRKVSKRELRDEAGFGNSAWIDIFSRMGPEIEVNRNESPPIVKFGTTGKKKYQKKSKQKRNSNREKNTDTSISIELVFHEVIDEKRYHLVSDKSFITTLLPFLKVEEILVFPWSVVCEKHLKRSGQRLAKLSPDDLNELLTQVAWPLTGRKKKIIRYAIKENELHLWGR